MSNDRSPAAPPLEVLTGSGQTHASFWELDLHNLLKLKSFVHLGMPHVFRNLNQTFNLFEMRRRGLTPIVYLMDFRSDLVPLAFASDVDTAHEIRLYRYRPTAEAAAGGKARERLLEDIRIDYRGPRSQGSREQLGYDKRKGAPVTLGSGRVLHVFTRPLGAAGERDVVEVPPEMSFMREHAWEGPYPSIDWLHDLPAGAKALQAGRWAEYLSVWGLPNTDINQHVNVVEYLMTAENHCTRMLFGAGVDLKAHRMTRLAMIFRKPFFPGDAYAVRGQLYRHGDTTLMNATVHRVTPEGEPDARPSVGMRCEGLVVHPGDDAAPPASAGPHGAP